MQIKAFKKNKPFQGEDSALRQGMKSVFLLCLLLAIALNPAMVDAMGVGFSSGSSGANGAFPPEPDAPLTGPVHEVTVELMTGKVKYFDTTGTLVGSTTLPNTPPGGFSGGFDDGTFHFTTFDLLSTRTLRFISHPRTNPAIKILAKTTIKIDGVIDVSGEDGGTTVVSNVVPGGLGGPGGFNGGNGGSVVNPLPGGGFGPGGGIPGRVNGFQQMIFGSGSPGLYGAAADFDTLIPLLGGSGGGGGPRVGNKANGGGGGGGGGAILLAANEITISLGGGINANGGRGSCVTSGISKGGSGGAIRLVAHDISGRGFLTADGEKGLSCNTNFPRGGPGRIRLEALFNNTLSGGIISPTPSTSNRPGPVSPTGIPPLLSVPFLKIKSVAGVDLLNFTGNMNIPNLTLPSTVTNPVRLVFEAALIEVGTTFTVRVTPKSGNPVDVTSTGLADVVVAPGIVGLSATADVNLPRDVISMISVFADFPVLTAGLYPLIDGEPVERIMIAANIGEKSQTTFVTKSGRKISEAEMLRRMGGG